MNLFLKSWAVFFTRKKKRVFIHLGTDVRLRRTKCTVSITFIRPRWSPTEGNTTLLQGSRFQQNYRAISVHYYTWLKTNELALEKKKITSSPPISAFLVEFQFSFSHGCFCLLHAAQRLLGPSQTGTRFVRHESDSKIQVYCAEKSQKGKGCEEELVPPEQSRTASQFISLWVLLPRWRRREHVLCILWPSMWRGYNAIKSHNLFSDFFHH